MQPERQITVACCARCGAWDLTPDEPCLSCSGELRDGVYKRRFITATVEPDDAAWLDDVEAEDYVPDDTTDWGMD